MERAIGIRSAGGLEQQVAQRRRRSPALLETKCGAQGLSRDVESAAFVAEDIAPAAGAGRPAAGIAAEGERPGAGDGSETPLSRGRAGGRYESVVGDDELVGGKDLGKQRLLVVGSAAHAEAGCLIAYVRGIETGLRAGFADTILDGMDELGAAFG